MNDKDLRDPEEKEQDQSSYKDNMTLEDIAEDHENQVKDVIIRDAKRYTFVDPGKAIIFIGLCLKKTMEYLGLKKVKHTQKVVAIYEEVVQAALTGQFDTKIFELPKKVKIEWRQHRALALDLWRCGMYIYKDDVLVTFISDAFKALGDRPMHYVVTNAKLDDMPKHFVMPATSMN